MSPDAPEDESRKLSILMLTDYFLPRSSGGVERAVFEVSRHLVEDGHAVTVLTIAKKGEPPREVMAGIEVLRVPGMDISGRIGVQVAISPHAWFALRRLLKQRHFDVVHTHTLFFHLSLAAAVLSPFWKLPLVTTAHLGSPDELGGGIARATSAYEATAGRLILRSSAAVIAVSQAVADHLTRRDKRLRRPTVIPNGVDLSTFQPASSSAEAADPKILFLGRLIFNKGPQYVVEAAPRVVARFPQARFLFAGDGPLRPQLEQSARRLGIESRVEFLGHRDDIASLLQQASLLLRPSLSEGMPLVALEAMACGLPVVATDVGGTSEVVQDGRTGFLLRPGDQDQLVDRVCRLLAEPELGREMGARGRAFVEEGFDWRRVSARTLQFYREVLAERGSTGGQPVRA